MRRLNPIVTLLTITCLACGVLLYFDQDSTSGTSKKSGSLPPITPLPGYAEPMKSPLLPNTPVSATNAGTNVEESLESDIASISTRDITVHVSGLKNQSSTLYVAVFDSADGFPKPENSHKTTTVPIASENVDFSLSLPNNQSAAIAVFQDLNGDGKLSKNSFGLPTDPYGFSNNARSLLGPPTFSQAEFEVSENTASMDISVR